MPRGALIVSQPQKTATSTFRRTGLIGFLALATLCLIPSTTRATDHYWNRSTGDWSDTNPYPWSVAPEPTSSDAVYIYNGGTATVSQTGEVCSALYLGTSGGITKSGTIQMTDGGLSSDNDYVGYNGTGSFSQSGGTNSITSFYLGYNAGCTGTYVLNGTGQLSAYHDYGNWEYVGYSGTGRFTQASGSNTTAYLYLGYNAGGSGTYDFQAGYLYASYDLRVGYSGRGDFTQSGGTNSSRLTLGHEAGGTGTYTLTGTGYLSDDSESIGLYGKGDFTQSGGTNITGNLTLGNGNTGRGTFTLLTGSLSSLNSEYVGYQGAGTLTQSGGTNTTPTLILGGGAGGSGTYFLSATGQLSVTDEGIGSYGSGIFKQSGGTNSISDTLDIGAPAGCSATYELSASGLLSAANEYVGYSSTTAGTLTQYSGINTTGGLYLGPLFGVGGGSGAYNLSGGQLTASEEYIGGGDSTIGVFTQLGGTNTVTTLYLGYMASSSGTYNLNGGTLITGSISLHSGTATFNFGGGTLQASGAFTTALPMTLTGDGGNANVDTAGNAVTLSGALSGIGGLNKLGNGTLTLGATNTFSGPTTIAKGKLTLSSSGSIGSTSLIDVNSGATFDVSAKTSGFVLGNAQTLQGSGAVLGKVTAASGSRIAPGDGVGTLTINGNLTLNSGAKFSFELGSPAASDEIAMSAYTLALNSQKFSDFTFSTLSGFGEGEYVLIDAGSILGSLDAAHCQGNVGGTSGTLYISGNDLMLHVPEPSTFALLATACLALLARFRRRG